MQTNAWLCEESIAIFILEMSKDEQWWAMFQCVDILLIYQIIIQKYFFSTFYVDTKNN